MRHPILWMTASALLGFACSETGQAIADAVADAIAAKDVAYDDSASELGQSNVQGVLEALNVGCLLWKQIMCLSKRITSR